MPFQIKKIKNEGHRHSKIKILIWKLKGKWHFGATFIDNAGKNVIGCIYLMNISMGFTYPISDRWCMCTIRYSIPRWRTAISCGQCRSSNMIYYAEMHRQTVKRLTWLKGTYYTEDPNKRFMFVTFQYYCICWMSKLPRLKIKKIKHHYDDGSVWMCFRDRIQRQFVIFMLSIIIEKEDFEVTCLYKTRWDSYPGIG